MMLPSCCLVEKFMLVLYELLDQTVNIYTMDHRGTGRSSFLDCVASEVTTLGSPRGDDIDMSEVPSCAEELEIKYGSDLSMFSITSAANDISSFISTFLAGSTTFVYGVSYGTAVVERLIHLAPDEVVGYILDGVSTTSGSDSSDFEGFSKWDQEFDEVGHAFMDLCTKDPGCSKFFNFSNLSTAARNLVQSFDNDPNSRCALLLQNYSSIDSTNKPGYKLRTLFATLVEDAKGRHKIPVLVYRFSRCDEIDVQAIPFILNNDIEPSLGMTVGYESEYHSPLLYYLIIFSEMWEVPEVSLRTMQERFTNATIANGMINYAILYCAFTRENSTACSETAYNTSSTEYQPIVYKKDQYWNKAAEIPDQASVLIMNGKMDPQTPYKYAEFLLDALDGENKYLVTFDYAPHATIATTPMTQGGTCGLYILASYVANLGNISMTNMSCVADQNALGLNVSWDQLFAVTGSISSSGDSSVQTTTSSESSSSSSSDMNLVVVIIGIVALVMILSIFCTFVVNYCCFKPDKCSMDKLVVQEDTTIHVAYSPHCGGAYQVTV